VARPATYPAANGRFRRDEAIDI